VLQYNKRDLPDALPTTSIDRALGLAGAKAPRFEACAKTGDMVLKTLDGLLQIVLQRFRLTQRQPATHRRPPAHAHLAAANAW
jgi:signal recognition particle receptor subunit beta